jgi:Sulfotransferase family
VSGAQPFPLPTFFIIGASKAGTTSLHRYLGLHPEIAMTEPKEPHLMVGPGWRDKARAYGELFEREADVRGESSTGYSSPSINPDAPGNIAELAPEARLVYLVRDPVERAVAQYAQHVIYGRESEPIERAVRPGDPTSVYFDGSRYATVVESFLRHFDAQSILVIDHRELWGSRRAVLARVFAHVGADPTFWDEEFEAEHNVRSDNRTLPGPVRRFQQSGLNRALKRRLPEGLRRRVAPRVRRALGREVRPDPSPALRAALAEALAPEADRLRELTSQRFAHWSV